ncbi:MAG: radical SAM protein, partial [bacterium]
MKITFFDPPNSKGKESVERVFGCNLTIYPVPNIFALTTAAVLRNEGHQVNYIDAANSYWTKSQFEDFLRNDDSVVLSIHSVNLSKEIDLMALEMIRDIKGSTLVVFTGPAPTYQPNEFIKDKNVYVIRGEPEFTFTELINELAKPPQERSFDKIEGLSFMNNGMSIQDNPPRTPISDLDSLPFPARDLLDKRLYYNPKIGLTPWTVVLTSRGCCYRCIYCVPCSLSFSRELEYKKYYGQKPPVRKRSVENIIKEICLLKEQGYKAISIIDDNFIWGEERTIAICNGIKGLGLQWGCLARAEHITEKVACAMAEAGCQYIDLGAESFNQEILDYIHKDLKVADVYKAIKILKKYGIDVKLNILLGTSPLETEKIVLENIKIVKKLKVSTVMFSIASPFPGTEFYNIVKQNHWFDKGDYYPTYLQKKAIVSYPNLSAKDLERLLKKANYSYYLSPSFIVQGLKRIKSFRGLFGAVIAYWRKLNFDK